MPELREVVRRLQALAKLARDRAAGVNGREADQRLGVDLAKLAKELRGTAVPGQWVNIIAVPTLAWAKQWFAAIPAAVADATTVHAALTSWLERHDALRPMTPALTANTARAQEAAEAARSKRAVGADIQP